MFSDGCVAKKYVGDEKALLLYFNRNTLIDWLSTFRGVSVVVMMHCWLAV